MGVCNCSMFCCTLLYVPSSFAIVRELVALLNLSSWCLVLPRCAIDLSAVCDCVISWSYSLTIFAHLYMMNFRSVVSLLSLVRLAKLFQHNIVNKFWYLFWVIKRNVSLSILTFFSMIKTTSETLKANNFFICRYMYFSFNEQ